MLPTWSRKRHPQPRTASCRLSSPAGEPAEHAPARAARRAPRSGPGARLEGLALLVLCAAFAWPSSGRAYTLRWTESGAAVRWNAELVFLRIDPALVARAPELQIVDLVAESAAAWHGLANVPEMLVDDGAPDAPGYRKGGSNNGVYWIDDWSHGANALAITVVTYLTASGKIVDADVLINAGFSFEQLPHDPTRVDVYDLHGVLTHEFGHVLGLGESCEPGATMWPVLFPGETFQRDLHVDDRAGAERLYVDGLWGEVAQGRGCGGASVLAGGPRGAAGEGRAWGILVALLAAILARPSRRRARTAARSALAIGGVLALTAPVGAKDPTGTAPVEVIACPRLASDDSSAAERVAKLVDGTARVVTGSAVRLRRRHPTRKSRAERAIALEAGLAPEPFSPPADMDAVRQALREREGAPKCGAAEAR